MSMARWLGGAVARAQIDTITIADTWATNDTLVVAVGTKSITLTIGSTVDTTTIAENLQRLLAAATVAAAALDTGYSADYAGGQILEMTEFTATQDTNVVTLTGNSAGVPFTVVVTETTAGDGTATGATATEATGPYHFDNPDNWEAGTVPADGDTLLFDTGANSLKYALDYPATNTNRHAFTRTTDYSGTIGLPEINTSNYPEYRDRHLEFYDGVTSSIIHFKKGAASATNNGATRILIESSTEVAGIYGDADALANGSTPSLEIVGGAVTDVRIISGHVKIGSETISGGDLEITGSIKMGRAGGSENDCYFDLVNAALPGTEDIEQNSGVVEYRTALNYTGGGTGTWTINGGVARTHSSTVARTLVMNGGTIYPLRGTSAAVYLNGGATLTMENSIAGGSSKDFYMASGSTFKDPRGLITASDFFTVGCGLPEVTIDGPTNVKYTVGTGASIS